MRTGADPARLAPRFPAAVTARRVAGAGALLGAIGIGSALLVVLRAFERWRLEPAAAAHHVSVFGARLSYPTANLAAVVVLCQAALGLAVLARAGRAATHELLDSRRLGARLRARIIGPLGTASLIEDDQPLAFCAGMLAPRVYVSTGAVARLDGPALRAVVEHEREHARRRDPLRLATGRVLAEALFFVPGLGALSVRHRELAELGADEHAVQRSDDARRALARAMLAFADGAGAGVDTARVDALLGRPRDWGFPLLLCLTAAIALAAVMLVTVLAGRAAAGAATLGVPFLSAQPCVLVLALVPVGLGWAAWRLLAKET